MLMHCILNLSKIYEKDYKLDCLLFLPQLIKILLNS